MTKRRTISKKERTLVAAKTKGRCGYCGIILPERWHIDHIIPFVYRGNDDFENMVAACPQCNNFKSSFSLEEFRKELQQQPVCGEKYSVNFRMSMKYGLIKRVHKSIIFYFEKISNKELEPKKMVKIRKKVRRWK